MTDRLNAFDVLAAASAALLSDHHPADVLSRLTADCLGPMSADSAAILVVDAAGDLGLLSASSHRAAEIELLQTQRSRGPCVDAIATGEHVFAVGAEELVERWDQVGAAISDAGYESVHAFPMHWHGQVLGGLNIFRVKDDKSASEDTVAVGQAFADVASLVLVQVTDVQVEQIAERMHEAIAARSAVEQAKGVLAYLHETDVETAYEELVRRAAAADGSLAETALRVVREQRG